MQVKLVGHDNLCRDGNSSVAFIHMHELGELRECLAAATEANQMNINCLVETESNRANRICHHTVSSDPAHGRPGL
jgi:hypothetical protein